jgi:hypothetical protein
MCCASSADAQREHACSSGGGMVAISWSGSYLRGYQRRCQMLMSRWVTLRARWMMLRARWVALRGQ